MSHSSPWFSLPLSRGAAFSAHIAISLLIFSSLVAMMLLYWFPGELFFIDGGWEGLKLVAMVDLILGPALTLLLYKPGKPKLILDMSLIAGIQIAALVYGFHTTHQQRTLAVVFAERGFNTVSANDISIANEQLLKLDVEPQPVPKVTMLDIPLLLTPDPEAGKYEEFLLEIMDGYPGPQDRTDQYVRLEDHTQDMKKHALDEQKLEELGATDLINASIKRMSSSKDDLEYYSFRARYAEGVVIFDPTSATILDYVAIEKPTLAAATESKTESMDDEEKLEPQI